MSVSFQLARRCVHPRFAWCVRWFFYPVALLLTLLYIGLEVRGRWGTVGRMYPVYLLVLVSGMLALEWMLPMRANWRMTWRLFWGRDVPMLLVNGVAIGLASWGLGHLAGHDRNTWAAPWWVQAVTALLVSDGIWYGVHRYSHEGRGRLGRWLWRTHVMHHLPGQVYVFMHAAGHPFNGVYVRAILMLPGLLWGLAPEAVFAASVLGGFQGLVSHFNVDVRAGWFNGVLVGTELHRLHHSADVAEAGNYAAVFSIWDRIFGTFRHPSHAPHALGVPDRDSYPPDRDWLGLWALPFSASAAQRSVTSATSRVP